MFNKFHYFNYMSKRTHFLRCPCFPVSWLSVKNMAAIISTYTLSVLHSLKLPQHVFTWGLIPHKGSLTTCTRGWTLLYPELCTSFNLNANCRHLQNSCSKHCHHQHRHHHTISVTIKIAVMRMMIKLTCLFATIYWQWPAWHNKQRESRHRSCKHCFDENHADFDDNEYANDEDNDSNLAAMPIERRQGKRDSQVPPLKIKIIFMIWLIF